MNAEIRWAVEQCRLVSERLERLLESEPGALWAYPVGTEKYPLPAWYAATLHDPTGVLNNGYGHTGIDLNVDRWPRGDIDRGQPVVAVADGVIRALGYSSLYLGSVIIEVEHDGAPLFVRYWHLADDAAFRSLAEWQTVRASQCLGHIGNYTLGAGGDHLHFDCALQLFGSHWWFTRHPEIDWVDPVPILKAHLDPEIIDAMLATGQ